MLTIHQKAKIYLIIRKYLTRYIVRARLFPTFTANLNTSVKLLTIRRQNTNSYISIALLGVFKTLRMYHFSTSSEKHKYKIIDKLTNSFSFF